MNNCATCKKKIPLMGMTGKKRKFCNDSCKAYHTNHIKHFTELPEALLDAEYCSGSEDLMREWVLEYGVDKKKAFRRKIFEETFGIATGLLSFTQRIIEVVGEYPGNDRLTSQAEMFNAWLGKSKLSICPVCETNWPTFNQTEWRTYCSEYCCNIAKRGGGAIRDSINETMVDKYGVLGGFTKERVERFNDEREQRTGYRISTQNPEVKRKLLERMQTSGRMVSAPEREIREYFESKYGLEVVGSAYGVVDGKQLDLYFPEKKLAVEYNGCFFHSEGNGGRAFARTRHLEKTEACERIGVRLIHVWEDEWHSSKERVLRLIESKLGLLKPLIYARSTNIVVNPNPLKLYEETHIQGFARATMTYGLQYKGELVAAMSFLKTSQPGVYELNRYASRGVHGAFSKLLKAFRDDNADWREVYSFGDRCVVSRSSNVYTSNGFKEISISPPDYKYTRGQKDRIHKFNFRKKILSRKYGLDLSMTESEMAAELGFKRIYNCGLIRYSIKNEKGP